MRFTWVSSFVLAAVTASPSAQSVRAVGICDVAWTNTTGLGTPVLAARIHYPAVTVGMNAPAQLQAGGWPTVVFLHGYSQSGNDYGALADGLAEAGFIAVMLNTAQFSYVDIQHDGRAAFGAIVAANGDPTELLEGAFDIERIGLMGHSMGGSALAYVLLDSPGNPLNNPGYVCGLAMAPVDPGQSATSVSVPFGIISGNGDTLTPPAPNAIPYYQALSPATGLKFHYNMGLECTHMNMVGIDPASPLVFVRSQAIIAGFFGQFLADDLLGLEGVFGPAAIADPVLSMLSREVASPPIWADGPLEIGQTTRISLLAEAGFGGLLAAITTAAPIPTVFGELLLDPATVFIADLQPLGALRMDLLIAVPALPTLIGAPFALQGIGTTPTAMFVLGSALLIDIE